MWLTMSSSLLPFSDLIPTSMEVEGVRNEAGEPPLVIVIEDFEAFDADVLKELISIIRYSTLSKA